MTCLPPDGKDTFAVPRAAEEGQPRLPTSPGRHGRFVAGTAVAAGGRQLARTVGSGQ